MNPFKKFIFAPGSDKIMFLFAIGLSLVVKTVIFIFPMRVYVNFLGHPQRESSKKSTNAETIQSVSRAVTRCSRYTPWQTKCLVDAITAKLLLRCNGISSTIFLGVDKNDEKELIAHAWLKCGETFVTGKRGYQRFTVVSSFG